MLPRDYGEPQRESHAGWIRDRPKRKALARTAGPYIVKQRTVWNQSLRPLYKELSAAGFKFQRYGGIPRRNRPVAMEYLKCLWKYVKVDFGDPRHGGLLSLASKPNQFDWRTITREQRDADIREWINARRLRDMLRDQIRVLRDLETGDREC